MMVTVHTIFDELNVYEASVIDCNSLKDITYVQIEHACLDLNLNIIFFSGLISVNIKFKSL
jgi:hypothetical protein